MVAGALKAKLRELTQGYTLWIPPGGSRLFTRETFKLLHLSSIYSRLSGTQLRWNQAALRMEVVHGRRACVVARVAQIQSVGYGLLTAVSYVVHGHQSPDGFDITTLFGFCHLTFLITGLLTLLCVFCFTTNARDFCALMNAMADTCSAHEHRLTRTPKAPTRILHVTNLLCAVIFGGFVYIPICIGLVYFLRCDVHPLYVLLPRVACPMHDTELPVLQPFRILTMFFVALTLYLPIASYCSALGLAIMFLYPAAFFVLQILQDVRHHQRQHGQARQESKRTLLTLRGLQAIQSFFNSTNLTEMASWHLILLASLFVVVIKAWVRRLPDLIMESGFLDYCLGFSFHYGYVLRQFWRSTEVSEGILHHARNRKGISRAHRVLLKSFQPFRLRFGFMGTFDKNLYMFGGKIIADTAMSALLM